MGGKCGKDRVPHDPLRASSEAVKTTSSYSVGGSVGGRSTTSAASSGDRERASSEPPLVRTNRRRNTGRSIMVKHNSSDLDGEYDVGEKAGEGTQGVVFRAKRKKTGVMRAIKKVPKRNVDPNKFKKEIEIMKMMDHPNIIKLFETFDDRSSTYLVMELCSGGELFDKVVSQGHLSEVEAAIVLQEILQAVTYMHENNIAHRDLKPENFIFLSKGPIDEDNLLKLIDFGIACECGPTTILREVVGTPYYIAPQVMTKKYDKMCDVWSCGVIMYTLLSGNVPFSGPSDQAVLQKVREGIVRYKDSEWNGVSDGARHLVKKLLTRNPKDRITARDALEHDWIKLHAPGATADLQGGIIDSIKSFRRKNRLKQATLAIVASELNDSQIRRLRETFTALDTNKDGLLTYAEIKEAFEKGGIEVPGAILGLFEGGWNYAIDYTEFLAATLDRRAHLSEEAIRMAFGMFDVDNAGKISAKDISKYFRDLNAHQLKQHSEAIVEKYSTADGALDFDDFHRMMCHEFSPPSRKGSVNSADPDRFAGLEAAAAAARAAVDAEESNDETASEPGVSRPATRDADGD